MGAGLSGLSCAYELAKRGYAVRSFEKNAWVGGRTASWDLNGMAVESGLHRFLGFYKALPALLEDVLAIRQALGERSTLRA